jgi:hypothetical protein
MAIAAGRAPENGAGVAHKESQPLLCPCTAQTGPLRSPLSQRQQAKGAAGAATMELKRQAIEVL